MRSLSKTMPQIRRSATEEALLWRIRFSLLMLNHRSDIDAIKRLRTRCMALEDHLNNYQPSAWFLRHFGEGPAFFRGMLISANEDKNGWHIAPLKGLDFANVEVA